MFRSLRFRLPALFLAGIVLSGVVSTVIAGRLFQDYARDQELKELRQEAKGLAEMYQSEAFTSLENDRPPPNVRDLERATGDRLYYAGVSPVPGFSQPLRDLPQRYVDLPAIEAGRVRSFEFVPPGETRTFVAVAHPVRLGERSPAFGAIVVAKPKADLGTRWIELLQRLALALLGGLAVAAALAWYLSRRITQPVLALSYAADEVAVGRYDIEIPHAGRDEIGHLAGRFREMAQRLADAETQERNFLMSVSHELRTPLTAIRGHVEALREGVIEDPELAAESLDVVASETERLARLVGDILDLAKLDARRFSVLHEEVDMERLVEHAYAGFSEEARRRAIEYRLEKGARPTIVSDGDRVLQIISNLLSNAFRWTPDGGRIGVELDAENGTVSVAVADTGPGIRAEERERIFRPFVSSQDGGGTGLGLAIARELANALGGRIDLASEPGRGSRFELVLPTAGRE